MQTMLEDKLKDSDPKMYSFLIHLTVQVSEALLEEHPELMKQVRGILIGEESVNQPEEE